MRKSFEEVLRKWNMRVGTEFSRFRIRLSGKLLRTW
jgi:hypothetical protein